MAEPDAPSAPRVFIDPKRYEWEDSLIDAASDGRITDGACFVALRLSRAINWAPKDGRHAGLYWKNDDALNAVGVSRSTFYRHRPCLFDAGFLIERSKNLWPSLPADYSELGSHYDFVVAEAKERKRAHRLGQVPIWDAAASHNGTQESHSGTSESQAEQPLSEDVLPEDLSPACAEGAAGGEGFAPAAQEQSPSGDAVGKEQSRLPEPWPLDFGAEFPERLGPDPKLWAEEAWATFSGVHNTFGSIRRMVHQIYERYGTSELQALNTILRAHNSADYYMYKTKPALQELLDAGSKDVDAVRGAGGPKGFEEPSEEEVEDLRMGGWYPGIAAAPQVTAYERLLAHSAGPDLEGEG